MFYVGEFRANLVVYRFFEVLSYNEIDLPSKFEKPVAQLREVSGENVKIILWFFELRHFLAEQLVIQIFWSSRIF